MKQHQTPQFTNKESNACGVGFIADRKGRAEHKILADALEALNRLEHRGGTGWDGRSSDGAGIMTEIPFDLLGQEKGRTAVAMMFLPRDANARGSVLDLFERTFGFLGLEIKGYRDVPMNNRVVGPIALSTMPTIRQAMVHRPEFCRTIDSFEQLLYKARQMTYTKVREIGLGNQFYFASLSAKTIVYKALTRSSELPVFYSDLIDSSYKTRFALFHRRFSTNTSTTWDKAQPFRTIAHNGEINTITGNRSWSISREMSMGIPYGELLTREGISDSGSMNEMVEALRYRSSITQLKEIMAILMPPAHQDNAFYKFWSRAMEPWDGPAMIAFADGNRVGARLDRNGFRPGRWAMSDDTFYLASEAGPFRVNDSTITARGALAAGTGVNIDLDTGEVDFLDSGDRENQQVLFHPRLRKLEGKKQPDVPYHLENKKLFLYTREDMDKILIPMITTGKEPIGSMGDTARPAVLSDQPRSFFDYFYQNFAQVTNPPVDYLREGLVTDLTVHLGRKPNIFSPKELIPPVACFELEQPVVSLAQMARLQKLAAYPESGQPKVVELHTVFPRSSGPEGLGKRLHEIEQEAVHAVRNGTHILLLSDGQADPDHPPVPSALALRALVKTLNAKGSRLEASILVHSGEVRETHHVAALVGFGAFAVCPYVALEVARFENHPKLNKLSPDEKENNLIQALTSGLLKIMAKMGISVVRGYHSTKLFTPLGLDRDMIYHFFKLESPLSGVNLEGLGRMILDQTACAQQEKGLLKTFQYKEHNKGIEGERHSMTNRISKLVHQLVRDGDYGNADPKLYEAYLEACEQTEPVNLRHLFMFGSFSKPLAPEEVEPRSVILKRFGSGAMSFGAINDISQRDIFRAMNTIGGRSNSGEGGENPFYAIDGTTASVKQIASGRFGVTANYLIRGQEVQIKMAQGAKPGEGGQLMGVKVNGDIAKSRFASPGVDLISPPPMHDIYSIEDLKELIYEIKQLDPTLKVSVKLVAGANIGTIAVGVVKAGADVVHVSGGDGGTGAASLSSMKHAGLPWELGLLEVHRTLIANGLRDFVCLRVDGGLQTGRDIVTAAVLGAEGYDFGKILLIAEGCVMARICEKNTCPTGIAVHDPKFKAKYKGREEHVVALLSQIAEHTRRLLSQMGVNSLNKIIGRTELLKLNPIHRHLVEERGLDLSLFFQEGVSLGAKKENPFFEGVNTLNKRIVAQAWEGPRHQEDLHLNYEVINTDRGILATLAGRMSLCRDKANANQTESEEIVPFGEKLPYGHKHLNFRGSAGQGFGAFLVDGLHVTLSGEANDSVCKAMSGGSMVINPSPDVNYDPGDNAIIGNGALYGATGGILYIHGRAGDRFAVRNSGATAIVEGAGLHACEYMTGGLVVLLGEAGANIGAGMTGGSLFVYDGEPKVHENYLASIPMTAGDHEHLRSLLEDYYQKTHSRKAKFILENPGAMEQFAKYMPKRYVRNNNLRVLPVS